MRRLALVTYFVLGAAAYVLLTRLLFHVPETLAEAEACGLGAAEIDEAAGLRVSMTTAWWLSFMRTRDYLTAISMGLLVAFAAIAVVRIRQIGRGVAAGALAGGGLLGVAVLCVSCLGPVLSAIGLGFATTAVVAIPKWLVTVNTALLITWGTLFLSRRAACAAAQRCAAPATAGSTK